MTDLACIIYRINQIVRSNFLIIKQFLFLIRINNTNIKIITFMYIAIDFSYFHHRYGFI